MLDLDNIHNLSHEDFSRLTFLTADENIENFRNLVEIEKKIRACRVILKDFFDHQNFLNSEIVNSLKIVSNHLNSFQEQMLNFKNLAKCEREDTIMKAIAKKLESEYPKIKFVYQRAHDFAMKQKKVASS